MNQTVAIKKDAGSETPTSKKVLVLGLGNAVLSDDGVGVHVIREMASRPGFDADVVFQDGGTVGLGLLPGIAQSDALIVVDAAELHAPTGTVRVFEGAEMDAQVSRSKGSVHEIAFSDLMTAAAISGTRPPLRALVAIQPRDIGWGTEPTPDVAAAVPVACGLVEELIQKWSR